MPPLRLQVLPEGLVTGTRRSRKITATRSPRVSLPKGRQWVRDPIQAEELVADSVPLEDRGSSSAGIPTMSPNGYDHRSGRGDGERRRRVQSRGLLARGAKF